MSEMPKSLVWTPDLVERFWDAFSQTRLTELSFSKAAAPSIVSAVWRHLSPLGTHLDLGAGDGDLVAELLKAGFRVAAYEPSRERSRVLDERFSGQSGYLGCTERVYPARFDVVFLCEVLEHILAEDYESFLNGLGQAVRDGGTVIVTTPNHEDLELGNAICPSCLSLFHRWQHQRSFDASSLEAAMENAGFQRIVTHQIEFRDEHFDVYQGFLRGGGELPSRLWSWHDLWRLSRRDRLRWRRDDLVRRFKRAFRILLNGEDETRPIPDYIYRLREDETAYIGAGTQLLYIGRKEARGPGALDVSRSECLAGPPDK